jgi:polysaccharide biosynthesis/export protein
MLRQICLTRTSKRRVLPSGRAASRLAIFMYAGLLTGCATSPDQLASSPSVRAIPSKTDNLGPNGPDVRSTTSSGVPGEARASSVFSATTAAGNSGYVVGPLDVLEISVFKVPELSKSVQVANTGTINLPLVGEVAAAGKTAAEIEKDLTQQLGAKYLKSPQVTVYVKEHNSQRVTVEGAVRKPGVYPIRGTLSLLQLIATAEGLDKDLYSKDVTVFRTVDGQRTPQVFDIDAIREGKVDDPPLRQGDLVVVDTSAGKTAFQNTIRILPGLAALRPTVY